MVDPKTQLREDLRRYIKTYWEVKSLDQQLRLIDDWRTPNRNEALKSGSYFFKLVIYNFKRTILLELTKLVGTKEDGDQSLEKRSLIDWLEKAKTHASVLDPTIEVLNWDSGGPEYLRKNIAKKGYVALIEKHQSMIHAKKNLIDNIRARRDKVIAHTDTKYFNTPEKLFEDFPIELSEVNELIEVVQEILAEHHKYLLESTMYSGDVVGLHVDSVLRSVRAWRRVRTDRKLRVKGFKPNQYVSDDYVHDAE